MAEFFALSIIILLFSVILHEVMHGYVALRFGDSTAQRAGRLTLNPIPHIDPIGTILLPGIVLISALLTGSSPGPLLAWAKPVPVNPLNFSSIRKGELFVSAAGVMANFSLAIICALLLRISDTLLFTFPALIDNLLYQGVRINLFLGIFNLLPIPPLDGSKMLMSQLPYGVTRRYQSIEPYGFFILIVLIFIFPTPLFFVLNFLVRFFTKLLLLGL